MTGANMRLNGTLAKHVRGFMKRLTSKRRRGKDKRAIYEHYS